MVWPNASQAEVVGAKPALHLSIFQNLYAKINSKFW